MTRQLLQMFKPFLIQHVNNCQVLYVRHLIILNDYTLLSITHILLPSGINLLDVHRETLNILKYSMRNRHITRSSLEYITEKKIVVIIVDLKMRRL